MGNSIDQIEREIAQTRENIEGRVIELRRQSRVQLQRLLIAGLVVVGVAAAVGGAVVAYRISRPITWRERARRLLPEAPPPPWRRRRRESRKRAEVEEPEERRWERLAFALAKAAGTAAGAAAVSRLLQSRRRED